VLRKTEYVLASLLLFAVVILVGIAAISRAVGAPIIWSVEVAQLLFLWLCVLAIDLGMQEERHFGLQIVNDNFSPRVRRIVEIFNLAVMIVLLLYLMRHAWRNTTIMHARLDGALQIPGSFYHASMVAGFALLVRTLAVRICLVAGRRGN
jgi:TRAP-type C4-dicarboxylate transport system permease small subunit